MLEFCRYFFGEGTEVEFSLFTFAHFAPILLMLTLIYLIYRGRDRLRDWQHEDKLRYVMAFILIISDMSYYWRLVGMPALGPNPIDNLPLGVCGWAVIFCSFMVVGKSQRLFDIAYFWLLSGSLFALLTPTPLTYAGPTRFRYYQFWTEHTMGYIAIFYMIFVHKMRPNFRSAVRSYVALLSFAVIAYVVNTMLPGANYLYLARPESAPSVLDILPPNFALRTGIIVAVITLMFFLAYLPWLVKDRKAKAAVQNA
ncbi:MAG: TIGR02206 family membrane protein [Ruminococcaceae bacterium]|nr:TIGR02206 family membrane protein [Oscillospiraceae bacterium]